MPWSYYSLLDAERLKGSICDSGAYFIAWDLGCDEPWHPKNVVIVGFLSRGLSCLEICSLFFSVGGKGNLGNSKRDEEEI